MPTPDRAGYSKNREREEKNGFKLENGWGDYNLYSIKSAVGLGRCMWINANVCMQGVVLA